MGRCEHTRGFVSGPLPVRRVFVLQAASELLFYLFRRVLPAKRGGGVVCTSGGIITCPIKERGGVRSGRRSLL